MSTKTETHNGTKRERDEIESPPGRSTKRTQTTNGEDEVRLLNATPAANTGSSGKEAADGPAQHSQKESTVIRKTLYYVSIRKEFFEGHVNAEILSANPDISQSTRYHFHTRKAAFDFFAMESRIDDRSFVEMFVSQESLPYQWSSLKYSFGGLWRFKYTINTKEYNVVEASLSRGDGLAEIVERGLILMREGTLGTSE